MGDQLRDNFNSLRNIYLAILRDPKASSTFILIDTLDECENNSKEEITEMFRELFKEASEKQSIKVLINSLEQFNQSAKPSNNFPVSEF